jgi:hypothetical protein
MAAMLPGRSALVLLLAAGCNQAFSLDETSEIQPICGLALQQDAVLACADFDSSDTSPPFGVVQDLDTSIRITAGGMIATAGGTFLLDHPKHAAIAACWEGAPTFLALSANVILYGGTIVDQARFDIVRPALLTWYVDQDQAIFADLRGPDLIEVFTCSSGVCSAVSAMVPGIGTRDTAHRLALVALLDPNTRDLVAAILVDDQDVVHSPPLPLSVQPTHRFLGAAGLNVFAVDASMPTADLSIGIDNVAAVWQGGSRPTACPP